MFIRKRDPRYKSHIANQNAVMAVKAAGRTQTPQKSGTSTPSAPPTTNFVEQVWQKAAQSSDYADIEWAAAETGDDEEEWECVACGKTFRSEAAWDSHERSKKHMQAVERLKRDMLEEDEVLGLDVEQAEHSDNDAEEDVSEAETHPRSPTPVPLSDDRPKTPGRNDDLGEEEDGSSGMLQQPKQKKKARKKSRAPSPETLNKSERRSKARSAVHPGELADEVPFPGDTGTPVGEEEFSQHGEPSQPELSKRDKRRAREAAKKAKEASTEVKLVCHV